MRTPSTVGAKVTERFDITYFCTISSIFLQHPLMLEHYLSYHEVWLFFQGFKPNFIFLHFDMRELPRTPFAFDECLIVQCQGLVCVKVKYC